MKSITIEQVMPRQEQVGKFVGCISKGLKSKFKLIFEDKLNNKGWIFRDNSLRYGHSGHHRMRTEAIYTVLCIPCEQVMEFDNQEELDKWMEEQ